jgi:hypothetical protein
MRVTVSVGSTATRLKTASVEAETRMKTDDDAELSCTAAMPPAANGYYRAIQGQAGSAMLTCNLGCTPSSPFRASRRGPSAILRCLLAL